MMMMMMMNKIKIEDEDLDDAWLLIAVNLRIASLVLTIKMFKKDDDDDDLANIIIIIIIFIIIISSATGGEDINRRNSILSWQGLHCQVFFQQSSLSSPN